MAITSPVVEPLAVFDPSNAELIAECERDTLAGALAKVDRAHSLFLERTRWLSLHSRIACLEKLAVILHSRREDFAGTIAREGGKPLRDARVEVERAINGIKAAVLFISEHQGLVVPVGHHPSAAHHTAVTRPFPRGVVLAFSAFNHPLNLIVHQIIPAFAAGCPCVVKPAPDTPLSCISLINAMREAGIPADYIDYVITDDLQIASALVEDERIAFFSFIGSARVGWMLRAKLKPGVRCALEHGGMAPCFVCPSAALDRAVTAIVKGGFYHAGQVCVSTQRIFVHSDIHADFIDRLTAAVQALQTGNARLPDTDVGPLIRKQEVRRVDNWVREALQQQTLRLCGGSPLEGNFYQPTVLANPPMDAKVSRQEIFGPVVCVYQYTGLESAINLANNTPFAFQAAVFSQDIDEIHRAYDAIEASAVMVNDHTAFRDDAMPFAGLRTSGLGVGGIPYTIEEMQFQKMLVQHRPQN